jgi:hypothetical protein
LCATIAPSFQRSSSGCPHLYGVSRVSGAISVASSVRSRPAKPRTVQQRRRSRAPGNRRAALATDASAHTTSRSFHYSKGQSIGRATTSGNTTTFYDCRGRVISRESTSRECSTSAWLSVRCLNCRSPTGPTGPKGRVFTEAVVPEPCLYRTTLPAPAPRFTQATAVLLLQLRPYVVGVPVLSRLETAVTSCAGANGFCKRMLLGTPCDPQSSAAAPVM